LRKWQQMFNKTQRRRSTERRPNPTGDKRMAKPYYRSTLTSKDGSTIQDYFTQDCETAEEALTLFADEARRNGKVGQFSKPIDLNLVERRTATQPKSAYVKNADGSMDVRE
jgi:hypothetical protein